MRTRARIIVGCAMTTVLALGGCQTSGTAETSPTVAPTTAAPTPKVPTAASPNTGPPTNTNGPSQADGKFQVMRVVDGDTVIIDYHGKTRVRLLGIDTPETVRPDSPVECGGPEASAAAQRLLSGKSVGLAFNQNGDRHDRYGRLLAYITLPNGSDFGEVMVSEGYADLFYAARHPREERYRDLKRQAQAAGRGIWGAC